jgi:hypothetical protein
MSTESEPDDDITIMLCASCRMAEVDDIKLKQCPNCDLVRYCSDNCLQGNLSQHDAQCKERAAELLDQILFRQPESTHLGDCPICLLPLPIDPKKSTVHTCCSKTICIGCRLASAIRESEGRLDPTCPFCRQSIPKTQEESKRNKMKRIEKNDPLALYHLGTRRLLDGDYNTAFEYLTKAAELGDVEAHHQLSIMHRKGYGVEKDEEMEIYHLEVAAIGGHPDARYNLGLYEARNRRCERAGKHWIIAANLGCDHSLKGLKECYKVGRVSKDDFAAALRAHQAAVDATKSPQREAAAALQL